MKLGNLIQHHVTMLKVVALIASLFLVTACGASEEEPTPTVALPPMATTTSTPTATTAPTSTSTNTPEAATDTPAATATAVPTETPADTPVPAPPPTDTPTVTPVPLLQASETKVIYHDAEAIDGVQRYQTGIQPWLDLLVRLDDTWYGPERYEDDINATPLPEGYGWEVDGGFSSLPNGEAWWVGPSTEGNARLIGPDGSEVLTLQLKIEFY